MYKEFLKTPSIGRLAFLLVVVVPVISWFSVKPIRVLAPSLVGITCTDTGVCVDDAEKFEAATALYAEANDFIRARLGTLKKPRVIFCSTRECAASFGMEDRSALTVGTVGTVISPQAWKPYYVRHELIHQLQAQRLGVFSTLVKPGWLIEGMAYAMSDDPRSVLAQPWEQDRVQFRAWLDKVGKENMWDEAAKQ